MATLGIEPRCTAQPVAHASLARWLSFEWSHWRFLILENPGATSRDDAIFWAKLLK